MRFSLATIAAAALIFSASAAPHGAHKGRDTTDTEQRGGKGIGRGRYADGTYSGSLNAYPTRPANVSSGPFDLPAAPPSKFIGYARAKSDDSKSSKSDDKESSSDEESSSSSDESSSGGSSSSDEESSSGSSDEETSSGSSDKEASSGSGDEESSSGSGDEASSGSGSSSGSGDEETSSGSGDEAPSSGSGDEETSSGSGGSEAPAGSGDEETSSGSGDEAPSSGSGDEETSSGSGDEEPSSGGSSSGGSSSGGSSNTTTPTAPSSGGGGSAASGTFPAAAGESTLSAPMEVTDFDGGLVKFGRGVSCSGGEGGDGDAVFIVADGGSLSNVIIGADQIEGVHCLGACTITNVWWEAVCEDALSFKGNGDGKVSGGGARGAKDKVVQHNGVGTITISGFTVEDFGKLYRSCGNCKTGGERHVILDGIKASGGSAGLVGINSNFGDTATITNSCVTGTDIICQEFEGTTPGNEPKEISAGPSAACIYTPADVSAC